MHYHTLAESGAVACIINDSFATTIRIILITTNCLLLVVDEGDAVPCIVGEGDGPSDG